MTHLRAPMLLALVAWGAMLIPAPARSAPALPTHDGQLAFALHWPATVSAQAAFGRGTLLPRAKVEAGALSKTMRTDVGASLALLRTDWLLVSVGADAGVVGLVDVRAFPALSSQVDLTMLMHASVFEAFARVHGGVDVRALPAQGLLRGGVQVGAGVRYEGLGLLLTADVGGSSYSRSGVRPAGRMGLALVLPLFVL